MRSLITLLFSLVVLLAGGSGAAIAAPIPPTEVVHPIIGAWLSNSQSGAGHVTFAADGAVTFDYRLAQFADPSVELFSPAVGTWEAVGGDAVLFTVTQRFSHATGANLGSVTVTGLATIEVDGYGIVDSGELTTVTLRDGAGRIISVSSPHAGKVFLTGTRMVGVELPSLTTASQPTLHRGIPGCVRCI